MKYFLNTKHNNYVYYIFIKSGSDNQKILGNSFLITQIRVLTPKERKFVVLKISRKVNTIEFTIMKKLWIWNRKNGLISEKIK